MRSGIVAVAPFLAFGLMLVRSAAAADLPEIAGEPASVDITNTSILSYHFDNRNDTPERPLALTQVDDNFGTWLDRFSFQFSWWRLTLGARFDVATYFNTVDRTRARDMAQADIDSIARAGRSPPSSIDQTNQYYQELQSRYLRTLYLSKIWLSYSRPGMDITAGDFYVQLGRGLVFSVRKTDDLAIDTSVRGAKISVSQEAGPVHLGGIAFAGVMNPVRIDEQSGRRLHGEAAPWWIGYPPAGDLVTYAADTAGNPVDVVQKARPSYLDDYVVGGQLEAGTRHVTYALNGVMLFRKNYTADYLACAETCDPSDAACQSNCAADNPELNLTGEPRQHNLIRNFSGSVYVPSIAGHGDLYVELAGQQLRDGHLLPPATAGAPPEEFRDLAGYAFYGSASGRAGPVTLTLEGKHYRSFFPLLANIDTNTKGFGAREFENVAYSQPPRVESIYIQPIGTPDVCVTGGRARTDYRFTPSASVYAWVGRYASWSEGTLLNNECVISKDKQTNTWDTAVGTELLFDRAKSHAFAWGGVRLTDRLVPKDTGPGGYVSTAFYREGYVRYDLAKHIGGPLSLQAVGNHRLRFEPLETAERYYEGENYTALQVAPHFAAIFGYEYLTKIGCRPGRTSGICHYFNGALQWRSASDSVLGQIFDTVQVFVGQRRAALRCVSGVCRTFPPFEGGRLEVVSRF